MSKNINVIFFDEKTIALHDNLNDLKIIAKKQFDNFDIFYKKNETEEIKIDNDEDYKTYTSSNENLKLFIRAIGIELQKSNEKDNLKSIKEDLQLENNDNKTKSKTSVNPSKKNNEQNNIIEKKAEEYNNIIIQKENLIEKINSEKKELEKKIEEYKNIIKQKENLIEKINGEKKELEKKIEEKNNIIQQIFKVLINIYNTINSIGSINHPSNSNQNMDMNNIIKQISNDNINNINIVNNISQNISNNIFSELNKIRYIIQNIMNKVNNDNNKLNKKTESLGNQKRGENKQILSLIQSKTDFKPKITKNLPYSCVLRQDKKYQDISFDNLNQK